MGLGTDGGPRQGADAGSDPETKDTLAAIAGAVGEALHGLPEGLVQTARERYLQGAENITTTLDALYERAEHEMMMGTATNKPEARIA